MDAGVFDFLKGSLQTLLAFLQQAAADGRLQAWAEQTGTAIVWVLKGLWAFGKGVYETLKAVWPVLDGIALSIGGWDVVVWIAAFVLFRGTIGAFAQGLWMLSRGAFVVGRALLFMFGPLLRIGAFLAGGALRAAAIGIANAILWLGRAFLIAGRFLLANPIIAVITAIAGLAYVIYQNWDGIVGYFQAKIDAVRAAFDAGLLNGVLKLISEFNPFKLMIDGVIALTQYLTGWDLSFVKDMLYAAFGVDLFDTGIAMIMSLWDGIRAKFGEMKSWLVEQLNSITPSWMRSGAAAQAGVGEGLSSPMGDGFDAARATGGPVRAGMLYQINEQGTELFAPSSDGYVIPSRNARGARGGAGPSVTVGQITINAAAGMSPSQIARAVRRELEAMARAGRAALDDGGQYA